MPSLSFAASGLHLEAAPADHGTLALTAYALTPEPLHLTLRQPPGEAPGSAARRLLARLPPGPVAWPSVGELANALRTLGLQCQGGSDG